MGKCTVLTDNSRGGKPAKNKRTNSTPPEKLMAEIRGIGTNSSSPARLKTAGKKGAGPKQENERKDGPVKKTKKKIVEERKKGGGATNGAQLKSPLSGGIQDNQPLLKKAAKPPHSGNDLEHQKKGETRGTPGEGDHPF